MYRLFIIALLFCSCKKEKYQDKIYSVTLTCYSTSPKFLFSYTDKYHNWHIDTIYSNSIQKVVEMTDAEFDKQQTIKCFHSDSIYIKGEYDGKENEMGYRSTSGEATISIQLSQAK